MNKEKELVSFVKIDHNPVSRNNNMKVIPKSEFIPNI
jgi:hypothetical protein